MPPSWRDVVLPIPAATLQKATATMKATLTTSTATLAAKLRPAKREIEAALAAHTGGTAATGAQPTTAKEMANQLNTSAAIQEANVDTLAAELHAILDQALNTLLDICPKKPPRTGKRHARRQTARQIKKLHTQHKQLKQQYETEMNDTLGAPPPVQRDTPGHTRRQQTAARTHQLPTNRPATEPMPPHAPDGPTNQRTNGPMSGCPPLMAPVRGGYR